MTWRWLLILPAAAVLAYGAGFIAFSRMIEIAPATPEPAADAIVALTGAPDRLEAAMALLALGRGERLLISGVDPSVGRATLARLTGGSSDIFECCVDMDNDSVNTTGNAVETARWAQTHRYDSLVVVTSADHMPRALAELGRLMPDVHLAPYPVSGPAIFQAYWWAKPAIVWRLATEYTKYLLAMMAGDPLES